MSGLEFKTGQSVDIQKQGVIHPVLIDHILQIPGLPPDLSLVDIGSGDATSSRDLLISLINKGKNVKKIGLIDSDIGIFPDLIEAATAEPIASFDTQVVHTRSRSVTEEFLNQYEDKYDLALLQLVLHQISSDHEASYLMYLAFQTLKPAGDLFVINLHPKYLQYLAENEPNKFTITAQNKDTVTGIYNFDSSGSASVYSRGVKNQTAMFMGIGFEYVKAVPISAEAISTQKPRYRNLSEKGVPMFYLMHFRKNTTSFVSSTHGVVNKIKPHNSEWIRITFLDGDEILFPTFRDWKQVVKNDHIFIQEIRSKEINANIINYWVINDKEDITGGQLVARTENLINNQ